MNSGSQNNTIAIIVIVAIVGVIAYFAVTGQANAGKDKDKDTSTMGDEIVQSIDTALVYVSVFLMNLGTTLVDGYNRFKNFVIRWAPESKAALDFFGDGIQSFVSNILSVLPEACIYTIRYSIKIPYGVYKEIIWPLVKEIGVAGIEILRELARAIPAISETSLGLADTLSGALGLIPSKPSGPVVLPQPVPFTTIPGVSSSMFRNAQRIADALAKAATSSTKSAVDAMTYAG